MPAAILVIFLLAAGCGTEAGLSAGGPITVPGPGDTLSTAAIGGLWLVEAAKTSDAVLPANARGDFNLEMDPSAAATVELRSRCGLILGSLTFEPNEPDAMTGRVSFSLPGRAETECSRSDRTSEDIVASALEQVSAWSYSDLAAGDRLNRLTLTGGDAEVVITRG